MKIAVSACLLGEKVRFDAGHKKFDFIVDELSKFASFVPFCPEHIAFGSPRESIRMVEIDKKLHIISNKTHKDLTQTLEDYSKQELEKIKAAKIDGIILKAKSPTCGLGSSKVYLDNGFANGKDDGVFARLCKEEYGYFPIEEEGRLGDPWLRENFMMQMYAYKAFEEFKAADPQMKELVKFHQDSKFLLSSKNDVLYRTLGRIVGNHDKKDFSEILKEYEQNFKKAISLKSSIKKTRNVLEHMAGFVKNFLSKEEKKLLHEQITDYANKIIPLITPILTLKLYATKYKVEYLLEQTFLDPYPKEFALRSDIKSGK
ncbi:MAG: DUF523 and DUF1722 domain-containing protein [Campylobacterales bacterium]|nr:DUF523 and DUF1722 domain-containing protein [Campylobacterales bacterium]